ncbi:MAG: type II toxin-antitoxin system RelE/ParE family toxin [Nostoc sp. NMS1]|nr:type II toxin-antitoxin system RelE/ParE family toxin [Nostoc sp. NMS1]MBN3993984.1 type II toxin-antitoxin system RelE/ParE family toxin [Nostoc sp. NMS2]
MYALLQKIEDEEDENDLRAYHAAKSDVENNSLIAWDDIKKLQGEENTYRIKVGDYRVIYDIFDDVLLVSVIDIGHRSKVYKNES